MIKRLIFDVDNTLILWKKEYDKALDKTLDELQYPKTENLYNEINNAEIEYEKNTKKFDKIEMTNYINKKLNLQLPNNFIEIWLKNLAYCIPEKLNEEDYKTLEYLYNKYELVILTNWFKDGQLERLKKLRILKFFKQIYGAEKYMKPHEQSFIQAMEGYKPNEVAIIGDDLKIDIEGAQNAGIKNVVWRNIVGKSIDTKLIPKDIKIITELSELKQIF